MTNSTETLIWIDLEMTGLDPDRDRILEIATLATDAELREVGEGPVLAIRQDEETLRGMDEWNRGHHGDSGLLERVRNDGVGEREAELRTLEFVRGQAPPNRSPMCGNSICQDRRFLYRWMPELERYFHYRNLDVSTVKELYRRWAPELPPFDKQSRHLAQQDIRDSIEELRFYRQRFFRR